MARGQKGPTVLMHRLPDGADVFEIVHERYVELIREPRISRCGYVDEEIHHVMTELATRSELRDVFGLEEGEITATIHQARADAEARRHGATRNP